MTAKNKKYSRFIGALCLVNVLSFLVYYFCVYVFSGDATAYALYFYSEVVKVILPIASATAVLISYARESVGKCLLRALIFTLPWLIYLFPFYAYEYAYQRLVIEAVISFATIHTAFMIAMLYLETVVISAIMIFAARLFLKKKKMPYSRIAILSGDDPLDFATPSVIAIFSGCSALFLYNLIKELIYTIDFIKVADGIYENADIIYMVIKYVFILGMLILSHFIAHRLKKRFET